MSRQVEISQIFEKFWLSMRLASDISVWKMKKLFLCLAIYLCSSAVVMAQPSALLGELGAEPDDITALRTARALREYTREDFGDRDRELLADIIANEEIPHRDEYFLLAGYLGMNEALSNVSLESLTTSKLLRSHGLAMVRAGDPNKANQLLMDIREVEYGDAFVYDLAPLLVYTRDRAVFDLLIERLLTSNLNCDPPNPHVNGKIDCGYRLMEALAPVLVDFPFEVGISGDLETDDYPAALVEVRNWLRALGDAYNIIEDTF